MPILNPIDQLIHDLVKQRAKVYRERTQRFKAQQEQQRKAAEAHEKKQLEYMRSAGVKVNEIEQDLKEDSRKLKSYLEQTRPSLISRPAMNVTDAKNVANWAANLGGLGQLIPPYAGIYYPPDGGVEVLPVIPSKIKIKYNYSGSGWGWFGSASATDPPPPAEVAFYFIPDQSARYSFTASFAFHGFYILRADDGAFTSKDASVKLGFSLQAYQIVDRAPKSFPNPIDRESQNINEFDNFDHVLTFSDAQDFRQGEPVVVVASITIDADARGDGSYAEINFADGDANYIEPQYLWVTS
jgi:hypothetical protein